MICWAQCKTETRGLLFKRGQDFQDGAQQLVQPGPGPGEPAAQATRPSSQLSPPVFRYQDRGDL